MAGTALKRLMAEYRQLTLNPPEGIVAGPANEENFFEWEALIMVLRTRALKAACSLPSSASLRLSPQPPQDEVHLRHVPPQHLP
ncbi:Ubiquitin-conjugating enzyme E2 G2 [Dissostichus eleginoides]|uniref:Ubiquitin-conjugating enzyme E2 G2 n=1 Tax=Dissostichus eleginoides TaxID=100907 RepID=A0AAD9FHR2_DISEL|nr:Ubiquitin-conjugating enzyme E2 G2 [Dissostichus eleginoides]